MNEKFSRSGQVVCLVALRLSNYLLKVCIIRNCRAAGADLYRGLSKLRELLEQFPCYSRCSHMSFPQLLIKKKNRVLPDLVPVGIFLSRLSCLFPHRSERLFRQVSLFRRVRLRIATTYHYIIHPCHFHNGCQIHWVAAGN